MQKMISALANLVPQRFKLLLIGRPDSPSKLADAIHFLLNQLPVQRFVVLPCRGKLKGYRMKIDWHKHRSFIYGTWEPKVVNAVVEVVSPGMIALDAGAHSGFYTLLLSKLVGPDGLVISFEPLPVNFQILQENILLNNCSNIEAVNQALVERPGELELALPDSNSSLIAGPLVHQSSNGSIFVPAISVDDFLRERRLPVHFLKIDVEGAEELVLKGARKTIESYHPVLVVELHDIDVYHQKHPAISQLIDLGYEIRWLDQGKYCAHILASPGMSRFVLEQR